MALRVLLADESSTIKKVIQLALQDYGVEVKSVPIGLDVLPVTKSFQPDMILVDVLLQKKSGYEVAKDLKDDPATQAIPIVLMWSSFMEIDEAKAQASRAEKRLEKPFDAEVLRQLVKDLVPRSLENKISSYLTFPKLPDFDEEAPITQQLTEENELPVVELSPNDPDAIYAIPEVSETDLPTLDTLEPEDEFSSVPLSATKGPQLGPEESWTHQDLGKLKQTPSSGPGPEAMSMSADLDKYMIPADELNLAQVETTGEFEEVTFVSKTPAPAKAPSRPSAATAPQGATATPARGTQPKIDLDGLSQQTASGVRSAMDDVMAEKVLRQEAQVVLEKVLWQILPDICERVVREELSKLLKDTEKSL